MLSEKLGLIFGREKVISLVGSGGKTTLLFLLARQAAQRGLRVAAATTTHIRRPQGEDLAVIEDGNLAALETAITGDKLLVAGSPAPEGKLGPPSAAVLSWLLANTDVLVLEADGSRGLPLKFPNATEPVILPETDRVIAVAGLSGLGKPLEAVCHRPELARERLGFSPGQIVTPDMAAQLLLAGYGQFSPTVLLNQADTPELMRQGEKIAEQLRAEGIAQVFILSLQQEEFSC